MPNYSVTLQRTLSEAANSALGSLTNPASGSKRRGKVYSIIIGSEGVPADTGILLKVDRVQAPGTGTAVTPQALDPDDVTAAVAVAKQNLTADPASQGTLLSISWNQRSTVIWSARPGRELVYPAEFDYGFALRTPDINATGPLGTADVFFEEQ